MTAKRAPRPCQRQPEWIAWCGARVRCRNPRHKAFASYGGRGIKFAEVFDDFKVFLAEVGRRPSPQHSLDRINNDGDYAPGNIRWATKTEQVRNRRCVRLSPDDVRTIRSLAGRIRNIDIARRYGVRDGYISKILKRQVWADLPDEASS